MDPPDLIRVPTNDREIHSELFTSGVIDYGPPPIPHVLDNVELERAKADML
jgi:hypothetical protein